MSDQPIIPRWLTQHPPFVSALDEIHRDTIYDEDPFCHAEPVQRGSFHGKYQDTASHPYQHTTTHGAKFLVACTALRAYRNDLTNTIRHCCKAWSPVARCFDAQAVAATLLGQNGNILDIASAICSRANRVLGFVSRHRVHLLMQALCCTAYSCKTRSGRLTHCVQLPVHGCQVSDS